MSVAHEYAFGPYTAQDLLALPDEGKRFELVDGWLIELSPSPRHNQVARSLMWILMRAAEEAGIDVCVSDSAEDITTPAGIRRPDVMVLDGQAARTARKLGRSAYHGADVLLVVEVISRGSGSEREDRSRKLREYALAGIDQYWIIDFDPDVRIQMYVLDGDAYRLDHAVTEGSTLKVEAPLRVIFDPAVLADWK